MRPPLHKTTLLPKQLRDELGLKDPRSDIKEGGRGGRGGRGGHNQSRKERRKAERSQKKQPPRRPIVKQQTRNVAAEESADELPSDDDVSLGNPDSPQSTSPPKSREPKSILKKRKRSDERRNESEDENAEDIDSQPRVSRSVRDKLAKDDAEIAALEKALGIKGRKKLPKSFDEDGLGELLGDLGSGSESDSKKRKREGDDWLKNKRMKALKRSGREEEILDESSSDEDEDEDDGDLDNELLGGLDEGSDVSSDDEEGSVFEGFEDNDSKPPTKRVRENPYVAPVTAAEANRPKYIPPSLRAASSAESESLSRLRRQVQGHLNKLSEANLISILGDIEKLFQDYPRRDVTSTLIGLLLGLVSDRSNLNDTFIILHAGFIASIYKVIGPDFGAELTQRIVERLDEIYEDRNDAQLSEGKTMANLISVLSHLYNFHVIGCGLVFDYIRLFLKEINEINTELLLKVIKNSGSQLRQDDPSALKDIVLLIQPAIAQVGETALSVRTKFMIDMITDLKNNRLKSGFAGTAVSAEHMTRMKKVLGSLNSRNLRASEPLRIGRMDIHNSSKKGKWWLVGASWRDDDGTVEKNAISSAVLPDTLEDELESGEVDLAQLARAHRMNTDVRRSIFVAIMSASDCQDAHMRLTKLRLKRNQEVEIPHVLIHCASEEETHNPYYTLIARKLCDERKMKASFMFSLWDIFKRMGERANLDDDDDDGSANAEDDDQKINIRSIVNLAKMFGSLVADGALSLGILKTLDFLYMQPKTKTFVELFLITTMVQTQQKAPRQRHKGTDQTNHGFEEKPLVDIFLRTRETPQVISGLKYFLRKVVAKSDVMSSKREKRLVKWGCRIAIDTMSVISENGTASAR